MKRAAITAAIGLALTTGLWASTTLGGIKAVVVDAQNQPIAGARLELVHQEFSTRYELETGEKGEVVQMGMKVGDYDVTIAAEGFETIKGTAHVTIGKRSPFEVKLTRKKAPAQPGVSYKVGKERITPSAGQAFAEAQSAYAAGRTAEAIARLEKLRMDEPEISGTYFMLADWYRETGAGDKALGAVKQGLELQPASAGGQQVLGELLEEAALIDEAIAAYSRALELDPMLAVAHKKLGMALLARERYAAAAAALERYVELKPQAADAGQMKIVAGEARKLAQ